MWGQSFELEHSQAAGREAVLVLLAFCVAITLGTAAFAGMLVQSAHRFVEIMSEASAASVR